MNDTSTKPEAGPGIAGRIKSAVAGGIGSGLKTMLFLIKITVPVSLGVTLLQWSGLLLHLARFMAPLMSFLGLPGEAALVLISGMLLSNYSAIAVMGTLSLTMREVTILAIMALTAHNLIVETTVMKKTGSSAIKMVSMRIIWAFIMGFGFNLILPADKGGPVFTGSSATAALAFLPMLSAWGLSTLKLIAKIILLVLAIMIGQRLMEEFRITELLSRLAAPLMRVFGLPQSASFLWILINVVGYAYGAAIIMARVKDGKMKPQEADLVNHHACLCHSLFEDTVLYIAIGVPLFWITVPRLVLAIIVVWFERFRRQQFRKGFKVGTA